ncbi:hypothetical protein GJ744_004824 [Endocarpon pusillum]|uniref:Uncharacterized protein n=1 Tax=Endocarpon pusillum TaxID=364733 RepID=A0A8H7A7P8_9EURO|nr:hypothetical protein GJ744_004824 [Endocarpon pusillum]
MPETAPIDPTTEEATLKEIALHSFCSAHNDESHVANAVREWQRVLTAERAALARIRRLQSEGVGNIDDSKDDNKDSDISPTDGSDSDGDNTTNTATSIGSDSNSEPSRSPETEKLREELARVRPEVQALRAQIERTTPELDELRQQLARAIPEAEFQDLREQLERATLESEQVRVENEQIRRESAQFVLHNRRLRQTLDVVRRVSAGLDAEPEVEEGQSEPLGAQAEQSAEPDIRSEEAELSSGAFPSAG